MNSNYTVVAKRAAHRCEYCHAPEVVFNFFFEVEHIMPTAQGGLTVFSNLALSCRSCNAYKGTQTDGLDIESNVSVALFNPRQDDWSRHFRVDVLTGEIVGLSATGRVTVTCLKINNKAQLEARKQWMRLRVFP